MGSVTHTPPPLPQPTVTPIAPGISLLEPLSRRGHGPGLIVLVDAPSSMPVAEIKDGFPTPAMKWAEESYAVVEVRAGAFESGDVLKTALEALSGCTSCMPKEKVGIVAYSPSLWAKAEPLLNNHKQIVAAAIYDEITSTNEKGGFPKFVPSSIPTVRHLAGKLIGASPSALPRTPDLTVYSYPTSTTHTFAIPSSSSSSANPGNFHSANESVSHTRNLSFLKPLMQGPYFDLEQIWDEHTYWEFENRSTEMTMSTMVQEPYVNHIPTLTGGIGRSPLSAFYQKHFIYNNPADTELELISRTVGIDRVVDEFVFKFTHDQVIDWLLPGVPPTGIKAEVPFTAVVNVRGDRLYHEHIAWDQASCLRQLGLLPEYLPFPYPVFTPSHQNENTTDTTNTPPPDQKWEYRLPTTGTDTARKMRDKNSVQSNQMFSYQIRPVRD